MARSFLSNGGGNWERPWHIQTYKPAINLLNRVLAGAPEERIGGLDVLLRQQTLRQVRHPLSRSGRRGHHHPPPPRWLLQTLLSQHHLIKHKLPHSSTTRVPIASISQHTSACHPHTPSPLLVSSYIPHQTNSGHTRHCTTILATTQPENHAPCTREMMTSASLVTTATVVYVIAHP